VSRSTAHGSGADLNGDGHVGGIGWRHRRDWSSFWRHPQTSSDLEDSILDAEIEAVRRLLDKLDLERTRIGIVSLREYAQIRSSIGNPRHSHRGALDALAEEEPEGRTDIAGAIREAMEALRQAHASAGPYRDTGIILLSDGKPTVPAPDGRAAEEAIQAARDAFERGIRIYTIALGISDEESESLREIAALTGGVYTSLLEPADIIEALPNIDLRGVADITVRNLTTAHDARAMRVWADGSFDGFVELRPGVNRLRVTARGPRGEKLVEDRLVYFDKRAPRDDRERAIEARKLQHLRDTLRERSLEVQVAREMELRREQADRSVRVETDSDSSALAPK
jgi:hypothetical protein